MRRQLVRFFPVLSLFILCILCTGCFECEKKLVLKEDGSGELAIRMKLPNDVAEALAKMRPQMARELPIIFPPLDREEIEKLGAVDGISVADLVSESR